ncbi:MAG: endonuclease domain-containing protein [Actinomycetes bacterium]
MTAAALDPGDVEACRTALARAGKGAAVSHELAARAHGVELVDDPVRRLTVPRNRSRLVVPGWQVRRAPLGPDDAEVLADGLRFTTLLRTLHDLCRVLAHASAVASVDSALRAGLLKLDELTLSTVRGRGASALRLVGEAVDPAAGSVLESLLRTLLREAGLLPPLTQYVVTNATGEFVARVDFCWPAARLIVEADGFAHHSSREAFRSDRRRQNQLERLGWRVLRFSWEDVVERPEAVVALVRECLAAAA